MPRRPMLVRSIPLRLVVPALALAACAGASAGDVGVRIAPSASSVSCPEWVRRAVAAPELDVERVPEPVAYDPPPIPRRLPAGVVGRDGRAEVRIKVVVDTLGRANMKTFRVV